MKRVFAVIIVVLLALGMVGLFFASFIGASTTSTPTATYTTTPAPVTTTTTTEVPVAPFNPAAAATQ